MSSFWNILGWNLFSQLKLVCWDLWALYHLPIKILVLNVPRQTKFPPRQFEALFPFCWFILYKFPKLLNNSVFFSELIGIEWKYTSGSKSRNAFNHSCNLCACLLKQTRYFVDCDPLMNSINHIRIINWGLKVIWYAIWSSLQKW